VKSQNAMIEKLVAEYGGWDKIPDGAFPPILDQHSDDSNDRVRGRLTALLRYELRDVPKVGKNVPCAVTTIKFIGKETVEKVVDGRIYHLSVGIDETTDTLGETSIVIDPAADGAMLLNKGKKKMAKIVKKLKKVNNKASTKRLETLKKMSKLMAGFKTKLVATSNEVKMAKREASVGSKIKKLMSSKKLSPAEFKKMDIKKLAKLNDESLETIMDTYSAREDVIMSGQRGTTDGVGVGEMTKSLEKSQFKKLKGETRGDFKRLGKKMKDEEEDDESHLSAEEEKKMSEDIKKAKAKMAGKDKPFEKEMAEEKDEDDKDLSADDDVSSEEQADKYQEQIDELTTQMSRIAGMVEELMDSEKEEDSELSEEEDDSNELEEGEDEESEMSEEDKDEEKDLSEEDEDEEKKKLEEEVKEKKAKLKKK
jgi:hypothetical protein